MAEVDPRYVHHGFWTDRSKGTILGQTLTTDTRTSTILIALLAVLTSLGATHLWYILLFIYHQQCAKGTPSDGLTKQRQAIIRTLPEPSALAIESVKIWWAWRQKGKYIFLRCIHLTTLSVLFSLGMLFASVFSAFIVSDTNIRVLVSSPLCGIANASLPNHVERYRAAVAASANSYVRDCYRGWSDTLPHQCRRIFATSIIPFSRADVACPFEPALCENGMGFETDSGLLSMRRYFGLNLSPEDDVQFRRRTTCAVLPAGDHLSISNRSVLGEEVSDEGPGPRFVFPQEEFLLMRYGGYLDSDPEWTNLTFTESLWEANKTTEYYTDSVMYDPSDRHVFEPLPGLVRNDSETALLAVYPNKIVYVNPVNDPVFSAHRPWKSVNGDGDAHEPLYLPDHPGRVIGCAVQYQVCLDAESCTPLGPLSALSEWLFPEASEIQNALLELIAKFSSFYNFAYLSTLDATHANDGGIVFSLPDDQWKTEVANQEAYVWTALQILISDYAIGAQRRDPDAHQYVQPPTTEGQRALCRAQIMIKSGRLANINAFALILVVVVSCTFILIDIAIIRILIFVPRAARIFQPRTQRWIQDSVFQYQRMAYEACGEGTWMDSDNEIPTTKNLEKLNDLPLILEHQKHSEYHGN